jgi:hypothetical protein
MAATLVGRRASDSDSRAPRFEAPKIDEFPEAERRLVRGMIETLDLLWRRRRIPKSAEARSRVRHVFLGRSLVLGPNINLPMQDATVVIALGAEKAGRRHSLRDSHMALRARHRARGSSRLRASPPDLTSSVIPSVI